MKKIVIIITISVIGIACFLITSMFTGVIPNLFIDTSDLVCKRINITDEEVITFKFNGLGKSVFSKKVNYLYFETEEEALEYYNYYVKEIPNIMQIEGTKIITSSLDENEKENYGETRKQILKKYNEYGFKCE